MRPPLTRDLPSHVFIDFYWLKSELQTFCREHSLATSGSKEEITKRIVHFLQTGEALQPVKKTKQKKPTPSTSLSLDTVITENHRCSQNVRAFFQSVIPKFHFSTYIQRFFKENIGKTYQHVVDEWHAEEKRKKDPSYQKEIGSQFQYNQFTRDFFADPHNAGETRRDAVEEWNKIKTQSGSNRYVPKKNK